jgi:hypothetical protein
MVLELVDYIEEKLSLQGENDDDWKYFKEYCSLKYLKLESDQKDDRIFCCSSFYF